MAEGGGRVGREVSLKHFVEATLSVLLEFVGGLTHCSVYMVFGRKAGLGHFF